MDFNNCSTISNTSESIEKYLRYLQDNTDITTIPAVVMLVIFALAGLVGNSLVLVVYSKKMKLTPTKVLIMTIATFDLVANVLGIPCAIVTMFDTWNFNRPDVCKTTVFLASFTAVGGAISLLIVAVVRFRKVCRPYGWQITIKQAIIASLMSFIIAFICSIPYILLYGVRTRETPCPPIQGYDCFVIDSYFFKIWPLLNNLLFIFIYLSLSISMVVLYIFIGVTAWKHSRLWRVTKEGVRRLKNSTNIVEAQLDRTKMMVVAINDSKTQSDMSLNIIKPEGSVRKRINSMLCGAGGKACESAENDASTSSNVMKSYTTTTDVDTDDITVREVNIAATNTDDINVREVNTAATNTYESLVNTENTEQNMQQLQLIENGAQYDCKNNEKISQNENINHCNEERQTGNAAYLKVTQSNEDIKSTPEVQKETKGSDLKQQDTHSKKKPASKQIGKVKREIKTRPLGRMTAMLIIISAVFVLGFLPFLILTVYKNRYPERYASLNMVEQTFYNLFYRLYFLNSAANPIIYSLCDLNFRRECFHFLSCRTTRRRAFV